MSFSPKIGAFLGYDKMPVIMSALELELPVDDGGHEGVQSWKLPVGKRLRMHNANKSKIGYYSVHSWCSDEVRGPVVTLTNTVSNNFVYMTNWQLSVLERQGRLLVDDSKMPGAGLTLAGTRLAAAKRALAYVDAVLGATEGGKRDITRTLIEKAAAAHAAAVGDPKPISYNTMIKKLGRLQGGSHDRLLAVAPLIPMGGGNSTVPSSLEDLISDAVEHGWKKPKGSWKSVREEFLRLLDLPKYAMAKAHAYDEAGYLKVSDRTFQRRFAAVDRFTRAVLRYGPEYAKRKFDIYLTQQLPDSVLAVVEVDYTEADIVVIDRNYPILYGRPYVLIFRDRRSGSILGFSIGFDNPSHSTFVAGLRAAVYPKDMSRYPGLKWCQYGLPLAISVDNEASLIGDNMRNICSELGIQLIETLPGQPHQKGGVERMFRTLNDRVLHNLPGTTLSNSKKRAELDDAKEAGVPVLFLDELQDFVTRWICAEYHNEPHKGLGFLRTLAGVPNDIWLNDIHNAPHRPPLDPMVFIRLCGDVREVSIQNTGIRWDHIIYASADLLALTAHPMHHGAVPGVDTTTYKAYRDPWDLGKIWVIDPYRPDAVIEVPVTPSDAKYATGLTLYQHNRIIKWHNEKSKRPIRSTDDLVRAREAYGDELSTLLLRRKLQKTAELLATFRSSTATKIRRSQIVDLTASEAASAERLRLDDPFKQKAARSRSLSDASAYGDGPPAELSVVAASGVITTTDPIAADVEAWQENTPPRPSKKTRSKAKKARVDKTTDLDTTDLNDLINKYEGYDK